MLFRSVLRKVGTFAQDLAAFNAAVGKILGTIANAVGAGLRTAIMDADLFAVLFHPVQEHNAMAVTEMRGGVRRDGVGGDEAEFRPVTCELRGYEAGPGWYAVTGPGVPNVAAPTEALSRR